MSAPPISWMPSDQLIAPAGVVVGCNRGQEWLLPWWHMNFRIHNQYPITFVDFGDMSESARRWCRERGRLSVLEGGDSFIAGVEDVDPSLAAQWQQRRAHIWSLRKAWFKIPPAMLLTPFEKSVWMDLDCQVTGSIAPLFDKFLEEGDFAVAPESATQQLAYAEQGALQAGEVVYNAGVAAYRHGAPLLQEWAKRCVSDNSKFMGCQKLLAEILAAGKYRCVVLPRSYNWAMADGENSDAVILHHWGAYQEDLRKHIAFLKNKLHIALSINNY